MALLRLANRDLQTYRILAAHPEASLPAPAGDLRRLTPFAVDFRHHEKTIALITTDAAGQLAETVFQWAKASLDEPTQ